jgi:hypothetical protein
MPIDSLSGSYIDQTFQRLVQTNDARNEFADGLGQPITFGQTPTGSLLTTASAVGNTITFTKGNGDQFDVTVTGGSGGLLHGTAAGIDTYTTTIAGATAYTDGDAYLIRFTNGNTTGCTLNINGQGAVTLYRNNDGVLIGGDIINGAEMLCVYNSSLPGFQTIGAAPNTLIGYVTNGESITITKGQPVYAFSGTGDRMVVKLASNIGDSTSAQTVGVVASTSIGANQKGLIMIQGLLDGLSILKPTDGWNDGDPVYLGATTGSITNIKPSAPNHLVYLGVVTTSSPGAAGRWYVRVQNGYELNEIHDVKINGVTTGDLLVKSGSLWINTKQLTGSYSLTGSLLATSFTGSLFGTSSWATEAVTASYAPNYVLSSATSSFILSNQTSSFVTNNQTSSFVTNTQTSSFVLNSQTSSMLASYVLNSQTSSFVTNTQTSSFVLNNQTSSMTVATASFAATASWANNAVTASKVLVTNTTTGTGPYYVTFTQGTSNDQAVLVDSNGLLFNATTNTLTVTSSFSTTSSYTNDFDELDYLLVSSFRTLYNY